MTTLLESGAKPFGSSKGAVLSMLIHGGIIAGAIYGTAQVVLPPREKVEEHPVLYVASPPPPPVAVAPKPLPAVKTPPKGAKAPEKVYVAPRRVATPPQPQPKVPTTPALVAPTKVPTTLAVNLQAAPTISDVVAPPPSDVISSKGGVSREGSVKNNGDGDEAGGKGGLGSGSSGKAYDENTVDRAVTVTRASPPKYPESLRSVNVEGSVVMRFIVGADGRVEPGSINVVSTPHRLFAEAVRAALLETRYRPAEAGGHAVRQVVEQSFSFKLQK